MTHHSEPKILFSQRGIDAAVKRLATEITGDYKNKNPLLIGILKGSFVFLADLARKLDFPLELEFVRLASYGKGRSTAGKLKLVQDVCAEVKGRHVLVVEDIVDTGHSVAFLLDYLSKKGPVSLKFCVLADKPSRRETAVKINYVGFTVPNKFIVGYGMDYDEKHRNLPYIGYIEMKDD